MIYPGVQSVGLTSGRCCEYGDKIILARDKLTCNSRVTQLACESLNLIPIPINANPDSAIAQRGRCKQAAIKFAITEFNGRMRGRVLNLLIKRTLQLGSKAQNYYHEGSAREKLLVHARAGNTADTQARC